MKPLSEELDWPSAEPLYRVKAGMFKGLGHPWRVRVLEILVACGETPVAVLLEETGLDPSHLSQHLAVLRRYGLVIAERRASFVYYRLAFPEVADLLRVARRLLIRTLSTASERLEDVTALPSIDSE